LAERSVTFRGAVVAHYLLVVPGGIDMPGGPEVGGPEIEVRGPGDVWLLYDGHEPVAIRGYHSLHDACCITSDFAAWLWGALCRAEYDGQLSLEAAPPVFVPVEVERTGPLYSEYDHAAGF
jgi:hypothetical protein